MQTPIRIFSPFMNGVNRTYTTAAPVRLLSDDDDFDYPFQVVRPQPIDPRYVLRRVDNDIHSVHEGRVDYSMCVDTDDEKMC